MTNVVREQRIGGAPGHGVRLWFDLDTHERRELSAFLLAVMGPPQPTGVRIVTYHDGPEPWIRVVRLAYDRAGKHLITRARTLAEIVEDYPLRVTIDQTGFAVENGPPISLPAWWRPFL